MENQTKKLSFIEHIVHAFRLFEEKGLDIDRISEGNWPSGLFSAGEENTLKIAMEYISFMDGIPGGFFIYYASGEEQLIYANKGALRMFLCDTLKEFRQLTGNSFKGIVHPDDLEAVEESIKKQILSDPYNFDYVEYRICRRDGSIHWVDDYGHLIHDSSAGDVFYVFLGNSSDTRLKQQIQQMQQMKALAKAFEDADLAVKAKNTFLAQISHEMRTPLNAILGFTTLAKLSLNEPEAISDYLKQIESASNQLLSMITQALDVSALSGTAGSAEEKCNLCETLQEIHGFLLPLAENKELTFHLRIEKITHRNVYTVSEWFRQMVTNLANNAITYTNPGGSVTITLTEDRILPDNFSVYKLEVRDTGIGMESAFLERIFEPFSRETTSTLSGIPGFGLGLTLVKSIVDLLSGSISVKSEPGKGSTFTVTIPFQVEPEAPSKHTKQPLPANLRILLVEDNDLNREIETELLERQGFVIDAVDGGRIAFEKVQNASPDDYDLILMDLQMPEMSGWEVAAAIRSLPDPALAHIPIIALSANVQPEDRRRSLENGIDVHLPKPMDFGLLMETIRKITQK